MSRITENPTIVTPVQMRRALRRESLLDAISAWVAASGPDTQDAWEYTTTFERSNPLIAAAAAVLGKTSADIDNLFRLAASL